jgi:hypothetical protein
MFAVWREEQNLWALSSTTDVCLPSRCLLLLSIHCRSLTISVYSSEGRTKAQALPSLMLEVPLVHYELLQCSVLQPPFPSPSPSSTVAISHRACQACHYLGLRSISCYCFLRLPVQGSAMDSRFTQSPHPKKMQSKKNDNIYFFRLPV